MRIRGESHLVVFLALCFYSTASDGTALSETDPRDANLCYWVSTTRGGFHYSFLRESAGIQANAPRLYLSTWTESLRLVDCTIVEDSAITKGYLSLCQEKHTGNLLGNPDDRFNTSLLLASENPCVIGSVVGFEPSARVQRDLQPVDPGHASVISEPRARRRKRSWIFPGTLWCGTGTKANAYDDIGLFEKTDRCCREHDHCSNTIRAFRVNYGVFNHNFFTVSHCDCDLRFRQCLQEVNDTISNMVGYSFFTMLKVPCFVFVQRKHCTQLSWWGLCKAVEVAPYAIFSYPAPYNSTQLVQVYEGSEVTAVPESPAGTRAVTSSVTPRPAATAWSRETCPPPGREPKTSKPRGRCGRRGVTRGDTFQPSPKTMRGGKGRKVNVERKTAPPAPRSSTSTTTTTTTSQRAVVRKTTPSSAAKRRGNKKQLSSENVLPTDLPWAPPNPADRNLPAPVKQPGHKENLQLCDCYKQLDECRHKILPHEEKYGLRNMEPKMLFHCNCTRGLSRQLRQLNEASALQSLLLDFVSLSCFKGLRLEDCLLRRRCGAVLSESKHLKRTLKRMGVTEVTQGPAGSSPKVKRQNSRKVRGKSTPVRLYNRCLRITSKNLNKNLQSS